ncbi:MAG: redoxin domain-containing protein [Methanoculleus sp.]|nr:redoxin domain-containing protein [Methanoculleus sp.]
MSELSTGMPAPDFCLPDADEETVCLADLRGGYAVVYAAAYHPDPAVTKPLILIQISTNHD